MYFTDDLHICPNPNLCVNPKTARFKSCGSMLEKMEGFGGVRRLGGLVVALRS
ncbi:hypothetical protein HAX54_037756, partial [Datura stramonium]|nr:hypothetical protein [Datura stramonium]